MDEQTPTTEAADGQSELTAVLGAWYAVACGLVKNTGTMNTNSLTLHTRFAESEEEAKGLAVLEAMKVKPGFAVWEVVCLKLPEAPNNEVRGGPSGPSQRSEAERS